MSKQQVAVRPQQNLSIIGGDVDLEELAREAVPIAGAGTSQDREDVVIPFLTILQDNSPQVKKRDAKYIENAEPGMLLRTDLNRIFSGEEGVIFQPTFFKKAWVEWVPRDRGGGFVATHEGKPSNAENKTDDQGQVNRNKWRLPNGNDIVETRYHFGHLLDPDQGKADPIVVGMTSSGHTISRQWMALMNQFRAGGVIAPSFFRAYRLKTKFRQNPQGQSWFVWSPEDLGWVSKDLRDLGNQLHQSIASGERRAADPLDIEADAAKDIPF